MASAKRRAVPADAAEHGDDLARRLIDNVKEMVEELHPQRAGRVTVTLDSALDRDLGLDSLARAELLFRLERDFALALDENEVNRAERVIDVLTVLARASSSERPAAPLDVQALAQTMGEAAPAAAGTLLDVLDWHAERHGEREHIVLWEGAGRGLTISYGELVRQARQAASTIRAGGLGIGERVAIMLPTGQSFFAAFFGILIAGGVPVPIYPPARLSQIRDHLRRQAAILNNAEVAGLITMQEARPLARLIRMQVPSLRTIVVPSDWKDARPATASAGVSANDCALLQYTSGSTGDPKGVVLSHANLLANIRAMGRAMEAGPTDVFVSWLPLYHDMGLIGAWLGSLYFAAPVVIMSPIAFLTRPERWLRAIHRYRATLSAAPNFAYELCLKRIADEDIEGIDLSSLRMVANGAEPVSPSTIRRFSDRFAPFGFRADAMAPVYGLAENAVGLAFPPIGRAPVIERISRERLAANGTAERVDAEDGDAFEVVACGRPISGHEVRVIDDTGRELPERVEGHLQFTGPSATSGYFHNPSKTKELFDGAWLNTGDLAYISHGDIFITGRQKDLIIRAGRNIHPHEVEEAIGEIDGVRRGCVAVVGLTDPQSGTERIVVLAETREHAANAREGLRRRIEKAVGDVIDAPPDDVVLGPPHMVPKTSSGKIRRSAARELYLRGALAKGRRAPWQQIAGLGVDAARASLVRRLRTAGAFVYAGYWWMVTGALLTMSWLLVMPPASLRWRWRVVRAFANVLVRSTTRAFSIEGDRRRLSGPGVVVANHASYFDVLVLAALVGDEPAFVAKKELSTQFFAGNLLRRLGILFVDRVDAELAREDSRLVTETARQGRPIIIFPEGTLTRVPGLLGFRLGGFVTAVEAGVPVKPVALSGTRSLLRAGRWFPRRGAVRVLVGPTIEPSGEGFGAAVQLRAAARAEILKGLDEPDLAGEHAVFTAQGIERASMS